MLPDHPGLKAVVGLYYCPTYGPLHLGHLEPPNAGCLVGGDALAERPLASQSGVRTDKGTGKRCPAAGTRLLQNVVSEPGPS